MTISFHIHTKHILNVGIQLVKIQQSFDQEGWHSSLFTHSTWRHWLFPLWWCVDSISSVSWNSTAKLRTSSQQEKKHQWRLSIILHWFNSWLIWFFQILFSWQKSNRLFFFLKTGRKRTLSQTLFYSVCVPAAHTWKPWGPVLVFPGLGAVSAFSQTASRPTILLWSSGVWVILRWLHMTGCQKLDRVKRKAGISHSSAFLRPFQACTQQ